MSDTTTEQVHCEVETGPGVSKIGAFANAFRVVKDTGDEFFLDFLTYSTSESQAILVARVRVVKSLLPAIRDRLGSVMAEMDTNKASVLGGPLVLVPRKDDDGVN